MLVVDAAPWAEIVSIRGPGDTVVEVPARTYTPFVRDVAPGEYVVTLRNGSRDTRTVSVEVRAGAGGRAYAEFRPVDALEYFKRAGW